MLGVDNLLYSSPYKYIEYGVYGDLLMLLGSSTFYLPKGDYNPDALRSLLLGLTAPKGHGNGIRAPALNTCLCGNL